MVSCQGGVVWCFLHVKTLTCCSALSSQHKLQYGHLGTGVLHRDTIYGTVSLAINMMKN
jgi:hypothetical protein